MLIAIYGAGFCVLQMPVQSGRLMEFISGLLTETNAELGSNCKYPHEYINNNIYGFAGMAGSKLAMLKVWQNDHILQDSSSSAKLGKLQSVRAASKKE